MTSTEANNLVAEAIGTSWISPLVAMARLTYAPSSARDRAFMSQLEHPHLLAQEGQQDVKMGVGGGDGAVGKLHMLGCYAIWRLLSSPGAQVNIISSSKKAREAVRQSLITATGGKDMRISAVVGWPYCNTLRVAKQPHWRLSFLPNNPSFVPGVQSAETTNIILGAGADAEGFAKTRMALEAGSHKAHTVRVWFESGE